MLNHKGTLEIETDRLVLRRFTVNDAENMFNNWANDSEVTKYLSWKPHGKIDTTKDILNSWVQDYESTNVYNWAIVYKNDSMVIGSISVVESSEEHRHAGEPHTVSGRVLGRIKSPLDTLGFEKEETDSVPIT